jgi:hypothetical protein
MDHDITESTGWPRIPFVRRRASRIIDALVAENDHLRDTLTSGENRPC